MVSSSTSASVSQLTDGLSDADKERVMTALEFVTPHYTDRHVITGQNALQFVVGVVSTLAMLRTDVDSRIAALLFELPELCPAIAPQIEVLFGKEIADLVTGIRRLMKLREAALTQHETGKGKDAAEKAATQMETLRKMVLAADRNLPRLHQLQQRQNTPQGNSTQTSTMSSATRPKPKIPPSTGRRARSAFTWAISLVPSTRRISPEARKSTALAKP